MMLERLLLAVMLGVPVAASFAIPRIDSKSEGGGLAGLERIPCCAFRHITGIPCPLCGLTRSFVSTAEGRLRRAFMFNLLGPPLFVLFAVGSAWSLATAFRKRGKGPKSPGDAALGRAKHGGVAFAVVAAIFVAAWAAKLAFFPREYW